MSSSKEIEKLYNEGAFLIIAGVPVGTEFGIDLCSYHIDEHFRGIKMIPSGPHYIYCSAKGIFGDTTARVGFFHFFKSQEILIREWDHENEELRKRKTSNLELEEIRIRTNLKDLDRYLAPFDYTNFEIWHNLTDTISESGLKRYISNDEIETSNSNNKQSNKEVCCRKSSSEGNSNNFNINKISSRKLFFEDDFLTDIKSPPETMRFSKLPDRVPKESLPSEVSKHFMDCIEAVDKLLASINNPNDLLEEIQISFILFVVGYSMRAFSHWCKILNLLSNSETAVLKYHCFYIKYLKILSYQLPFLPEELMEQNDKNIVYKDVKNILINSTQNGLSSSANRLIVDLEKEMNWKFSTLLEEDPENMPVVVDISELSESK